MIRLSYANQGQHQGTRSDSFNDQDLVGTTSRDGQIQPAVGKQIIGLNESGVRTDRDVVAFCSKKKVTCQLTRVNTDLEDISSVLLETYGHS